MAKRNTGLLILMLSLGAISVHAQRRKPAAPQQPQIKAVRTDTTIKGTTLEVYQVYQPELKPMVKPELSPSLPPPVTEAAPQQYDVPQQTLYYSYRSLPLRPLALGKDTGHLPPQNYALLAGGNLSTILAEAGLGNLHGRDWSASVFGRYISQEGALENQVYRSFNLTGVGTYNTEAHLLEGGLTASRNVYGRYGYNHDLLRYDPDKVRMAYNAYAVTLGAQNRQPGPWGLDYHPKVGIGFYDAPQGNETTINIYLPATKRLDSALSIQFAINGQFAWMSAADTDLNMVSNHILQFAPALDYHKGGFSGHLGITPTISEGAGLLLLPDIMLNYKLFDSKLSASAGWQGQRIQNTLQQLTRSNPYSFPQFFWGQQTTRHEIFGSAALALGKHMTVSGRAAWQRYKDLPVFITVPGSDGKDFMPIANRNVEAFVWGGGIRYAVGEDLSIGAEGSWYNFYKHDSSKVWGEPAVRLKGNAAWQIMDGLLLTTYVEVLDKIWGHDAEGRDAELRGVFDFGAAGEYSFASRFSVFLRAENILGRRNERWLGYPSFGFNIYGGLRFRF